MTDFQRARSQEQRTARKQSILRAAATMLAEMPVSAISLNELSRRVGLAKSNVLRYFESREAVLLELLDLAARDFLAEAVERLAVRVDRSAPKDVRAEEVASGLAASFAARPMLCELLSAQAAVLEHNVSAEVATRYKQGARDGLVGLADLLRRVLPELGPRQAAQAAKLAVVLVGALWTLAHPAPPIRAVYDADPTLRFMETDFTDTLRQSVYVFLTGLLALDEDHG